jgi:hypothetical protein
MPAHNATIKERKVTWYITANEKRTDDLHFACALSVISELQGKTNGTTGVCSAQCKIGNRCQIKDRGSRKIDGAPIYATLRKENAARSDVVERRRPRALPSPQKPQQARKCKRYDI